MNSKKEDKLRKLEDELRETKAIIKQKKRELNNIAWDINDLEDQKQCLKESISHLKSNPVDNVVNTLFRKQSRESTMFI